MSCCGKKRQSLNFFPAINQAKVMEEKRETNGMSDRKIISDSVFRYTGRKTLEVRGVSGGRRYFFSVAQPQLSVSSEDAAMMRAFAELVEVRLERKN